MSAVYKKQNRDVAAWILKALCTNSLWFDESAPRDGSTKSYLYIPLFDIAELSRKYDLNTLKETCYLLRKNNHISIWGDDFDSRAMLVQVSDEGVKAYKKAFYGSDITTLIKRGATAFAALAAVIAIVIGISRVASGMKHEKYQQHALSSPKSSDMSIKSTAALKVHAR